MLKAFGSVFGAILLVDYRGFGSSKPFSERPYAPDQLAQDVDRIIHETRQKFKNRKIILYGHSLGGGILANSLRFGVHSAKANGIILEGTFFKLSEVVPWWLGGPLIGLFFGLDSRYPTPSNLAMLPQRRRMLLIHSRDDRVIPYYHGQRLQQHVSTPSHQVTLVPLRGSHNRPDYNEAYRAAIQQWLSEEPGID